jgi:small-conductance mechanosensitive channel
MLVLGRFSVLTLVGQSRFEQFQSSIEDLATTEGRLLVSGVIFVVTVLIAALIAPFVIRLTGQVLRNRLPESRTVSAVDFVSGYIPTTVGGLFLRLFQLFLFGVGVVSLLVIWGLFDAAAIVVGLTGLSLSLVSRLLTTGFIFFLAYIAAGIIRDAVTDLSNGADQITDHQREIIVRMSNVSVLAFAVTAVLTLWGLNLSGLLVGAGFLGIVVGMAARQTLGSMIAGFVLMFSRPFTIGDWVEIGENEGIVTEITIMNTRMRNFDGETIIMPNDRVSNAAITNRSDQGHLRIRIEVGIDYETDPDFAEEVALEALDEIESIARSPPPQVVPTRFGDSAVVIEVRFWIDRPTPPRRWRATREVINAVKSRFEEEGITIPFPQRTLSQRPDTDSAVPDSAVDAATPPEVESSAED